MEENSKIGPWTHGRELTPLQTAATELIPHGFSIALSIRELVRQGYLLSAEILLRPLIERAATISYLCETPTALPLWQEGWPYSSRPSLFKMLATTKRIEGAEEKARQITQHFNAIVHADPLGARKQVTRLGDGRGGYTASKSLNDIEKCDDVCIQAMCYLTILTARACNIFDEAVKK